MCYIIYVNDRALIKLYFVKNEESALSDFNKILEMDIDSMVYYNSQIDKGVIYLRRGDIKFANEDFNGAISDYNKAISINPNDAQMYYLRGYAKGKLKDFEASIRDYDKAIQLNPYHESAFHLRGVSKALIKDYEGACDDWKHAYKMGVKEVKNSLYRYCRD